MGYRKKKRITGSRSFKTPSTIPLVLLFVILLFSALSLLLSSTVFQDHLVLSELFLFLSMSLLSLFIGFVASYSSINNWIERILISVVIVGSLAFSLTFAHTLFQLYEDIDLYEVRNFESVEGVPSSLTFDGYINGPDYVTSITIQHKKVIVSHLNITAKRYKEHFKNKSIRISYLTHSKFAVIIDKND
ncbi:hypothetical protein ABE65_010775 [Fictibacillus phosphorivorans]|uniref:Uncharacterized protein n=1 Tax=Fictibacillus phosphorivorans TaxID=1221500 RepID=A0A161IJ13_9BACL|nr:hypothetical protein [Fictibacillus phosphorivorans]ANC77259.1 hypothetical protein ABE65_010775 [Fictibacillus phosphorivorans]